MEAKFTAGPWHVNSFIYQNNEASPTGRVLMFVSNNAERPDVITINAANWTVCELKNKGIGGPADARLIAAGPCMVEAIEFTLRLLDNLTTEDFSKGGDKPARDRLEAAYKMATGIDRNA